MPPAESTNDAHPGPVARDYSALYDRVTLQIEIPADDVRAAFEQTYSEIQRQLKVPGHARGQAPMSVVREMVGERVYCDILLPLVKAHVQKALAAAGYDPHRWSVPDYDPTSFEEGKSFRFTTSFDDPKPRTDAELLEELAQELPYTDAWRLRDVVPLAARSGSAAVKSALVAKLKELTREVVRETEASKIIPPEWGWELARDLCSSVLELSPEDTEAAKQRREYASRFRSRPA